MLHARRIAAAAVLAALTTMSAQERSHARSMVISRRGIVATSQTLASQAGAQVLARGGSAVDAAIAANAVLGVVEPMANGIGGDLFTIVWDARANRLTGLNASGWAPRALTPDLLAKQKHTSMPDQGIHSVTVPGAVDGWRKLHQKFGKLPWADLFQPAIYYANNGFPVTELIQDLWKTYVPKLEDDKNASRIMLLKGRSPEVGEVFRNPSLAKALELIASQGPDAFYKGPIAKAILATSQRLGGTLDAADLSEFQSEWVDPIVTDYRGWKVYELPPNSQGIAALEMLNIIERSPISSMRPADALHTKIEAQKLAYQDLIRFVADPRSGNIPVGALLSKAYATKRAALMRPDRAACAPEPGSPIQSSGDTIYLSVIDSEGNIVSLIQSIYLAFGSGVMVDNYGFHLHNRGGLFTLDKKHPNVLAGRKRPFNTIIPGFMQKGSTQIGFGIMGGFNQAQAHAQFVSNIVDHQMNIQAALEAPRFTKLNFSGCDVMIESRVPASVRQDLEARGHRLDVMAEYSSRMGGGQVVLFDTNTKVKYGASSPRKDGAAVPEPEPFWKQ